MEDDSFSTSEKGSVSLTDATLLSAAASTPASRTATEPEPSTPTRSATGRRKRQWEQEYLTVLREMQRSHVEQLELNRAQRERHLQMTLDDAAHARELEASLRREKVAAMSSFNQAFLGTLSQLVQALNRWDAVPPPLD